MDYLDEAARYPEHVADYLGENRLMALAVIMRAGEDDNVAGGIDANRVAFEQAAACAELARDARRRQTAGFDVGDDPKAA